MAHRARSGSESDIYRAQKVVHDCRGRAEAPRLARSHSLPEVEEEDVPSWQRLWEKEGCLNDSTRGELRRQLQRSFLGYRSPRATSPDPLYKKYCAEETMNSSCNEWAHQSESTTSPSQNSSTSMLPELYAWADMKTLQDSNEGIQIFCLLERDGFLKIMDGRNADIEMGKLNVKELEVYSPSNASCEVIISTNVDASDDPNNSLRICFNEPVDALKWVGALVMYGAAQKGTTIAAGNDQVSESTSSEVKLYKASWRQFAFFSRMSYKVLNIVVKKLREVKFQAGDIIVKQGSVGDSMYFIDTGVAYAMFRGEIAQELSTGDFFGEIAFISMCGKLLENSDDDCKRACDVVAHTDCRCFELKVPNFLSVCEDSESQRLDLMRILSLTAETRMENIAKMKEKMKNNKN
ncbi:hypothetical protein GUITHDRAFT_102817 [Guillardia theta CCMP2712]|uniref:Cyclic nucleotide-binding domain-containing protein n=1 Tax=Guillardia theta (strain CCMP2712) TaxID=905079 RepID=L1JTA5_GUITC|nr:hypothetical protein GUITHDRAFT_102817 [Guillardia theta CCMP2712]EKX51554.1 hypothetical protein GUITHDRAFT_102817 [Guillardia theta CCMP2712]|eukprot:XP_005838534.1 hypothetical protein GUITHDRAFT_102817 [Guillardia theta CCMP2712]